MPRHRDYGARVRIWDSGPNFADRLHHLAPAHCRRRLARQRAHVAGIAANAHPFHPLGYGQHCEAAPGSHLGKRVHWDALPPDVQLRAPNFPAEWLPQSEN